MNIPTYKLFRTKITPKWRVDCPWISSLSTHLIALQCTISTDTYDSDFIDIHYSHLRQSIDGLKEGIISGANGFAGKIIVTSIG